MGVSFIQCTPKKVFQGESYLFNDPLYKENRVKDVFATDSSGKQQLWISYDQYGYVKGGYETTQWKTIIKDDSVIRYGGEGSRIYSKELFVFNKRGLLTSAFSIKDSGYAWLPKKVECSFTEISYDSLGRISRVEAVQTDDGPQNFSPSMQIQKEDLHNEKSLFYLDTYSYDSKNRIVIIDRGTYVDSIFYNSKGKKYREVSRALRFPGDPNYWTDIQYKRNKIVSTQVQPRWDANGKRTIDTTIVETLLYSNNLPKSEYIIIGNTKRPVRTFTYNYY